ncbi:MAG: hypothetical protein IIZ56_06545 [Clostridia bacterium]|nr:hypothetical protein [Clostridia bacterium]MBR6109675.1 hypothetical protein [Clostridia bacterium]
MKKIFAALTAILMIFAAVACGKNGGEIVDVEVNVPTADQTTAPEQTQAPADTDAPQDTLAPEQTQAPAETAAPVDPNLTPEPTAVPPLPEGQVLWLNTMPLDLYGVPASEAEAWFSDAVFVGDSIMLGWKNFNNAMLGTNPDFFGQTRFLCEGSYGAGHALEPVSDKSLHPLYRGEQHLLWDSIQMMGAKKAFICFGLNDVAIYGVDGTAENFRKLCDKIIENSPDVKIYIISSMYLIDDSNMKALTNKNLRALNDKLRALCAEKGYGFVDIGSHLVGEDGYLKAEYCSDNYVHQTNAAYKVWADILRSLAAHNIKWGY